MLHIFSANLDQKLNALEVPDEARLQIESGKNALAAVKIPENAGDESKQAMRRAINESFVAGFRQVAYIAAGLALLSAVAGGIAKEQRENVRP